MLITLEVLCGLHFLIFRWRIHSDVVVVHNAMNPEFREMAKKAFVRPRKLKET